MKNSLELGFVGLDWNLIYHIRQQKAWLFLISDQVNKMEFLNQEILYAEV